MERCTARECLSCREVECSDLDMAMVAFAIAYFEEPDNNLSEKSTQKRVDNAQHRSQGIG